MKKLFRRLFPKNSVIEYFSSKPLILGKGFPQLRLGSEGKIGIKPGETSTLILGVHLHVPEDVTVMILLKPGLCTARSIRQDFPEMLPPGYRGNIRVRVTNLSTRPCFFTPNDDIAVMIPLGGRSVNLVEKPLREVDPQGYNLLPEY